jgi:hypothetical protein
MTLSQLKRVFSMAWKDGFVDGLERIWMGVVVACFELQSPHFPAETEEKHERPQP